MTNSFHFSNSKNNILNYINMKTKLMGLIVLIVISVANVMWATRASDTSFGLKELFRINVVQAEDCEDDEAEVCLKQHCDDGQKCECSACIAGSTDCNPDCPCCL
jgi:hypothetical protein